MDNQNASSDGEDIPSDFFDDFAKEEFIEGLSVVDSWDDSDKKRPRPRINAADVIKVKDLRDLIVRDKQDDRNIITDKYSLGQEDMQQPSHSSREQRRSGSATRMDSYIKPGSRRDPSKTNKAIKKDKEEKVKEYLAKHLESSDDIRPPGTELDDFFEAKKVEVKRESPEEKASAASLSPKPKERVKYRRQSPRREPLPRRRQQLSPRRPHTAIYGRRNPRPLSPRRYGVRRSPRRFSPSRNFRKTQRNSPHRSSPESRRNKSRSPNKHYRRSRSRSQNFRDKENSARSQPRNPRPEEDDFLYPKNYYPPEFATVNTQIQYSAPAVPQYSEPMIVEYPGGMSSGFSYPQGTLYAGYTAPYDYGAQVASPMVMPAPQPVPAPILPALQAPVDMAPGISPAMVPAPQQPSTSVLSNPSLTPQLPVPVQTPADALAKLVSDGVISHEDYLKLVPNKDVAHTMEANAAEILKRCNTALSRLGNITLPKRLVIERKNNMLTAGTEQPPAPPKFCSPLKRQLPMLFHFTKNDASTIAQRNKQIIETLTSALKLENIVEKKKKPQKNMKDAETQTTKPFCDVCEIRESTKFNEIGTSIDREHIFTSVHTQVVDHDLVSSKTVFNPSGSVGDSGPVSIAHMTPAQLVSQLAARAKTLKQTDSQPSNQYRQPQNRGGGGGGGNHYQHQGHNHGNNLNYRY